MEEIRPVGELSPGVRNGTAPRGGHRAPGRVTGGWEGNLEARGVGHITRINYIEARKYSKSKEAHGQSLHGEKKHRGTAEAADGQAGMLKNTIVRPGQVQKRA